MMLILGQRFSNINKRSSKWLGCCIPGAVAGLSVLWSNDYGFSCAISILLVQAIAIVAQKHSIKQAMMRTGIVIITLIVSCLLFAQILTLGHAQEWLRNTFGVGNYQSWYYNSVKSLYFYELDWSWLIILQGLLSLLYCILLFCHIKEEKTFVRFGVPAIMNMAAFLGAQEYKLLSGGISREISLSVLLFTIIAESYRLICVAYRSEKKKLILLASILLSFSWIGQYTHERLSVSVNSEKMGTYCEELGGNLTTYSEDIQNAKLFLAGDKIFSTYASAQEVVCNQFQPSGVDYIIHVLGDNARRDYLNAFRNNQFRYAATQRKNIGSVTNSMG